MGYEILLFVPNIIGYIRLGLLFASLVCYDEPWKFLCLYITSSVLDGVDGYVARKLNQTSAFGAWFDVVIDLISRGALWCFLSKWGYFMMMIEWLTFVCTHNRGPEWKIPEEEFPLICKMVMANGFKTPVGTYAITGIFVLPLWLYGMFNNFLTSTIGLPTTLQVVLLLFLVIGRALAMCAEMKVILWSYCREKLQYPVKSHLSKLLFYIKQHIKDLLHQDSPGRRKSHDN